MIIGFSGKAGSGKDTAAKCWQLIQFNQTQDFRVKPNVKDFEDAYYCMALNSNSIWKTQKFAGLIALAKLR